MCLSDDEIKTVVEYDEAANEYVKTKVSYRDLLSEIDECESKLIDIERDRRQHEVILFNMLPDEKYWGKERIKAQRDAISEYNSKYKAIFEQKAKINREISLILGIDIL